LPNLLDSSESDGTSSKDGDHKLKLTSPSPAPSEPCFSLKSTTSTSQAPQGPPKPPRDPNRVSSVDIRRNVPTFAMRNVAGSTTSLPAFVHSRTLTSSTPKDTEFIWKAPPAPFVSQNNLYENPPAAGPYSNSRRSTITQASTTDELSSLKYLESLKSCLEDTIPLVERTTDWCKSRLIDLTNLLNHDADLKMPININMKQLKELNSRMNTIMQTPSIDPLPKDEMINHELMRRIDRLQEQNRMLTTEVGRQSNRVTALEQDKRSLIKQLFQHSSTNSLNSNASTLR